MKIFISLIAVFVFLLLPELSEIRNYYPKAVTNSSVAERLYAGLEAVDNEHPPVYVAYKGAILVLKAKHDKNLLKKKKFFEEGAKLLDFAASQDPDNIEIRSLRLGIQENAPGISGYKSNMEEDKRFIMLNYEDIESPSLKEFIRNFILTSKSFSEEEQKAVR